MSMRGINFRAVAMSRVGSWTREVMKEVAIRRRTVVMDWKNMKRTVRFGAALRTILLTKTIYNKDCFSC